MTTNELKQLAALLEFKRDVEEADIEWQNDDHSKADVDYCFRCNRALARCNDSMASAIENEAAK
jgi:hypothetical protein